MFAAVKSRPEPAPAIIPYDKNIATKFLKIADAMYDAQQMKAPLNIMIRSPKFFIRMDEIKANKNIVEE